MNNDNPIFCEDDAHKVLIMINIKIINLNKLIIKSGCHSEVYKKMKEYPGKSLGFVDFDKKKYQSSDSKEYYVTESCTYFKLQVKRDDKNNKRVIMIVTNVEKCLLELAIKYGIDPISYGLEKSDKGLKKCSYPENEHYEKYVQFIKDLSNISEEIKY